MTNSGSVSGYNQNQTAANVSTVSTLDKSKLLGNGAMKKTYMGQVEELS